MSTTAFIYIKRPLEYLLDELEDTLEQALESRGEVTGSGTGIGQDPSNLEVNIWNLALSAAEVLKLIRRGLLPFLLPASSTVVIDNIEFQLSSS